jgi:peptide/nickel transport system permease protein
VQKLARRLVPKLLIGLIMIWAVATFTFFLVHALPGKPGDAAYENYILEGMSPAQAQAKVSAVFGFTSHQPLSAQYRGYIWNLIHGNLGQSISYSGVPVTHVLLIAAPWTVFPALAGLIIAFAVGVSGGVVAAVKRASRWGGALSMSGSIIAGIPIFMVALVLDFLFHTEWHLLPYGDTSDITLNPGWNGPYIWSVVQHAVMPVLTYAMLGYGGWLLTMKSSVVSVLGDDFILAAELRGLPQPTRMRYISRNAILPLFTVFALSIGYLLGGSVLVEDIFDYPGLGNVLLQAIGSRDYPLMCGAFLIITVAIVAANIVADLFYAVIDPRVRQ